MNSWLKEKKQDFLFKISLFFIFPVASFFYSFIRINTRSSYFIFSFMAILFGLAFSLPSGTNGYGPGYDGQFYRSEFENYVYVTNHDFFNRFVSYISFNSNYQDFYFETLAFVISRFTSNYHFLFMVSAIIFSYFCLKSFKFLTKEINHHLTFTTLILIILFLQNSLFNINGVRFWTTAWIAVYCIFQIFINKNKKYYLLALITPFFHISFYVFILVLIIANIFKKFEKTWLVFFLLSFAFSSASLILLDIFSNNFQSILPSAVNKIISSYTDQNYIEAVRNESRSAILEMFSIIRSIYIGILALILVKNSQKITRNTKTKDLYQFLLVWITIFNFLTFIPSLGGRFIVLSYPMIAYIWLVNLQNTKYNLVIFLLPLAFFADIYITFTNYLMVLDTSFFFTNPFIIMYKYMSYSGV